MIKLTIFLLVVISIILKAECSSGSLDPYMETDCKKRQTPGLICPDCFTLANCIFMNGQWEQIIVEQCAKKDENITAETLRCNLVEKKCTNSSGACNQIGHDDGFKCQIEGLFPNPYDCQTYHFCAQTIDKSFTATNVACKGNTAFSVTTNGCTNKVTDKICKEQQFKCAHAGDQAPWPGNNNIFYMCIAKTHEILYPILYRCEIGEVFNGEICIKGSVPTVSKPPPGPGDFKCTEKGLFKDPKDCTYYYVCDASLNHTRLECQSGTFFNKVSKTCVRGTC